MRTQPIERRSASRVQLRAYKPYSSKRIPGVNPEGHLGAGHRNFSGRVTWSNSTMKKIVECNALGNDK